MPLRLLSTVILCCSFAFPSGTPDEDSASQQRESQEHPPLEKLLQGRSLQEYERKKNYHDRIKILRKAFEKNTSRLVRNVGQRAVEDAYRTLSNLRGLAYHSLQASLNEENPKERSHKEVKKLEILLRKTEEDLDELKLQVPLENRFQFEETNRLLEELREQLLRQLFGKALGSHGHPGMGFRPSSSAGTLVMGRGLADLDRFTDEEFTMIQLSRELPRRVKAFLAIAESRLDEIERRVAGRQWKEDEPNPLELYTYSDLLHAYTRAIEGVMTNIDERATSHTADEGEIRKSLKTLSSKIEKFIPRLEALKQLVIERRDQELGEKLISAMETSDTARKGAQYGLGAPEREEK